MRFAGHAAVGGFILGSFAAPAAKPTITLVDASPVVVAGSGYTAGAHVLVSYRSGATHVRRRVTVTIAGRFRVVLRGVTFKRCDGLQLAAAGAALSVPTCAGGGRPAVTANPGGLVSGSRFVPGERVTVSAQILDKVTWVSLKANRDGTFATQLSLPRVACSDIHVRAVGALGSRASFTVAMPACREP